MAEVDIVKVTTDDIQQLQYISKQTFYETFSDGNTKENMDKYLEEAFSLEKLREEVMDDNSAFYFAKKEDNVIGYLKLNVGASQTELKDNKAIEIERIYVLKEFYGKKVGQFLFKFALLKARKLKADYIWLGVWEKNSRAIQFYKKNGFVEFDKHIFILGNDEQTDIMMKRVLDYTGGL